MTEVIPTAALRERLVEFIHAAFAGAASDAPFSRANEARMFARLREGRPLAAADLRALPPEERRLWLEFFTQYLGFCAMNPRMRWPLALLDGTSSDQIGPPLLAFFAEHSWPFPLLLPQ